MSALISFLPIQLGWHRDIISLPSPGRQQNATADDHGRVADAGNGTSTAAAADVQCVLDLSPVYAVVSSMISFYLPCIAMTYFYYRLHRYARRHAETIKRAGYYAKPALVIEAPTGDGGATPRRGTPAGGRCTGGRCTGGVSEHKAAITLGVIMGVFLLCWVPFFSINVVAAFCRGCVSPLVFSAFTWLGYLNSTMNPVIYSVFNRQFRDAFKRVLHIRTRCGSADGGPFYRGTEWDEASRGAQGNVGRYRPDDGRLSGRQSVSDGGGGHNSVIRSSSSCRDVGFALRTSCL